MTRAQAARLATGIAGVLATGVAVSYVDRAAWMFAIIVVGFVLSSLLSQCAFRALASAEERRRDLEQRVRAED